jgi:uncharacterized protein YrrD
MNITVDTAVYCTDGFYGRSIRIVLDPSTEKVTHIVVQQDGLFPHIWLVPISHVSASTPDQVQLDLSKKEMERSLQPFVKTQFLGSDFSDTLYTTDLVWPHSITNLEMTTLEHENIPLHELAVHGGAVVEATDGMIGHLRNFLVNPDDNHVTQIVIRAGHWLAHSQFAIPVSAIDHFDEDAIYLSLSKQEVKSLTTVSREATK